MKNKLNWAVRGKTFTDGSALLDWVKVYQSPDWHWQYDTHELSFAIFQHDGQYWKLYQARFVKEGLEHYFYDYGGLACRMVLVNYREQARSPHSSLRIKKGDAEWIRTYEYDPAIHTVLIAGESNERYGEPYENTKRKQHEGA
jgi:hypothetical protein